VLGVKVIRVLVYKKASSFGWHEFENTTVGWVDNKLSLDVGLLLLLLELSEASQKRKVLDFIESLPLCQPQPCLS